MTQVDPQFVPSVSRVESLKPGILRFVDSLRDDRDGVPQYRFSHESPPSLLATMIACVLLQFLRAESKLGGDSFFEWLLDHQDPKSGLFGEPLIDSHSFARASHEEVYVRWQYTDYALYALQGAGRHPRHRLAFLDPYRDTPALESFLRPLADRDPWYASNLVMFLLNFFSFEYARGGAAADRQAIDTILIFLEKTQDPATGFWGSDRGHPLLYAMAGAYHYYMYFLYWGRAVPQVDLSIDHTLLLQHTDGLYSPRGGGGACEDLDAVDILAKLGRVRPDRSGEITRALRATYSTLAAWDPGDAGLGYIHWPRRVRVGDLPRLPGKVWRLVAAGYPKLALRWLEHNLRFKFHVLRKGVPSWRYSGLPYMVSRMDRGDLFSTWFRLNTIALIEDYLRAPATDEPPYRFRTTLGLGWHDANRIIPKDPGAAPPSAPRR